MTLSHQGCVSISRFLNTKRSVVAGKVNLRTYKEKTLSTDCWWRTLRPYLCFSSRGRVYSMKVYQLPEATRGARGRPIVNLLPLEQDERITAILPVTELKKA